MLLLAVSGIWFNLGVLLFLAVCLILVLTVMIQKPQGGGLSAAFGASSGSGQTAFGTKTGDALTVATILVFVVWLIAAIVLNHVTQRLGVDTSAPAGQPGQSQPAAPGSTDGKPETPAPSGAAPDAPKPAVPQPEAPKPEAPKPEAPKPETPAAPPAEQPK